MTKALRFPYKEAGRYVRMLRPEVRFLSNRQRTFSFAYVGADEKYRNYIGGLMLGQGFTTQSLPSDWIWHLPEKIRKNKPECALSLFEINRFMEKYCSIENALVMPKWVEADLDISIPLEAVFPKRAARDIRRRIKKNDYKYEVTREKSLSDHFYYKMYLPYIQSLFDAAAYLPDYHWYAQKMKHSELLFVKRENTIVAGILLEYLKEGVLMNYVGYKDGDHKYVKEGALNALLYFTVVRLKEKHHKTLRLGLSKPFLKDGRLQYKAAKGARIKEARLSFTPETKLALAFFRNTPELRDFLTNNPFIFYPEKHTLCGAGFSDTNRVVSFSDAERICNSLPHYSGLEKWRIYAFGSQNKSKDLLLPEAYADKTEIFSGETLFSDFRIKRI
jgi:hypothetical protein